MRPAVAVEQLSSCGDGWSAVGVEAAMAAVVEDDVAGVAAALIAFDFLEQVLRDLVGGGFAPVGGHGVPRNRAQSELAGKFEYVGAARSKGRPEVGDRFAGDAGEGVAGARELVEDFTGSGAAEVGMGPAVVADEMAGVGDAASERVLGFGELADHEECGMDVVFGEDVEQARRPCGVRAVVEGEGKLARGAWGDESAAEDLRGGPVGGVGDGACSKTDTASCG